MIARLHHSTQYSLILSLKILEWFPPLSESVNTSLYWIYFSILQFSN